MPYTVALVVASHDYQPVEYSVPKKILEHSGITVLTVSDKPGTAVAKDGSTTPVDITLDKIAITDFDALFFIGGPGAMDFLDNQISYTLIKQTAEAKKPFGAICVSTRILAKSGVIQGKRVTGWDDDNLLNNILKEAQALYIKKDVVVDGNIITATGPSAAQEFGAQILRITSSN